MTILPGDYYETLAAKIPLPSLVEAERLVSCPPAAKPKKAAPPPPSSRGPAHTPPQFRVICTFTTLHGKPRFASLGQWPPEQYGGSIARLIQDARFFEVVRTRLNENIRPGEYAAGLLISLGKMGEPVWVKIDDEELEQLPELSFLAGN